MSITTMTNPGGVIDVEFYNSTASTILAGEVVMRDAAATAENFPVDRLYTGTLGPLEGLNVDMTQFAMKQGDANTNAGDLPILGVALQDVLANTWGKVRVYGPCLAKVSTTASQATLKAYGASTEAGQLAIITPGANLHTAAFQIGTSGLTTAGDKRTVFVQALGSQRNVNGSAWGSLT